MKAIIIFYIRFFIGSNFHTIKKDKCGKSPCLIFHAVSLLAMSVLPLLFVI